MNFDIDKMITTLKETLSTKTVIGEPMEFGDIKLIPVMSVYFGFGGGGGTDARANDKGGSGSGGGGGARIHVTGMIVIQDGEVSFLPTGKGGAIDKIMDKLPGLLDKAMAKSQGQAAPDSEADA